MLALFPKKLNLEQIQGYHYSMVTLPHWHPICFLERCEKERDGARARSQASGITLCSPRPSPRLVAWYSQTAPVLYLRTKDFGFHRISIDTEGWHPSLSAYHPLGGHERRTVAVEGFPCCGPTLVLWRFLWLRRAVIGICG